jgi:dTDP-4-amino-4,6-dideoxygalactose transaminase
MKKLRDNGVESAQVHYRNDRYSIFGGRRSDLPMMDEIEDNYLVLPLHTKIGAEHVDKICNIINSGW